VVMERMVVGSGSDNWGLGMRVWRERELRFWREWRREVWAGKMGLGHVTSLERDWSHVGYHSWIPNSAK
jgi:hypothetical protein